METQLDARYLRPGVFSWAGAIGLGTIGVGLGVLLACWGLSFFWHRDDPVLHRLDSVVGQLETLSQRITDGLDSVSQGIAHDIEAQDQRWTDASHKLAAIDRKLAAVKATKGTSVVVKRDDGCVLVDEQGNHHECAGVNRDGNVIRKQVTVFYDVKHNDGSVVTGWVYKDGASDGVPMRQFCYYTVLLLYCLECPGWQREDRDRGQREQTVQPRHEHGPVARSSDRQVRVVR